MNPAVAISKEAKGTDSTLILLCLGAILLGATPVALSLAPLPTFDFFRAHPAWQIPGLLLLLGTVAGGIVLAARLDSDAGPAKTVRYAGFVLVAALLTDLHYFTVDVTHLRWQIEQYGQVLAHTCHPPDQYRFLPQGTLWWLVLGNGNFLLSYLAYRFFFTWLVCLSIYKFARLYLPSRDAVLAVLIYAAFYPLSTRYYFGNLLDPMSHAAMITTLRFCQLRGFWCVFWLFILGVFIKETTLLLALCFLLMAGGNAAWRDRRQWQHVLLLGAAGIAVFLLCRLPFGFEATTQSLNRTPSLMIQANLGLPGALVGSIVPVYQRYLHPALFLFMWLPLIVWRRAWLPGPLFRTALYLALTVYATNLLFGWNYESRNFIPAFVPLVVCTLLIVPRLVGGPGEADATGSEPQAGSPTRAHADVNAPHE